MFPIVIELRGSLIQMHEPISLFLFIFEQIYLIVILTMNHTRNIAKEKI